MSIRQNAHFAERKSYLIGIVPNANSDSESFMSHSVSLCKGSGSALGFMYIYM